MEFRVDEINSMLDGTKEVSFSVDENDCDDEDDIELKKKGMKIITHYYLEKKKKQLTKMIEENENEEDVIENGRNKRVRTNDVLEEQEINELTTILQQQNNQTRNSISSIMPFCSSPNQQTLNIENEGTSCSDDCLAVMEEEHEEEIIRLQEEEPSPKGITKRKRKFKSVVTKLRVWNEKRIMKAKEAEIRRNEKKEKKATKK